MVKSLFAVFLIMPSAAAPAAAQVRVGVAVRSQPAPGVQVVGMDRRDEISTPLPLMSLSLSPSLSAPSVSPAPESVGLPVLTHPSVANQTPLSFSKTVLPAPAKGDDLRREASETIAAWKSARSLASVDEKAPASPAVSPESRAVQLDALFDGSLPASREVLSRAASAGVGDAVLARALSDSRSPSDAASRLVELGLLGSKESALASSSQDELRFLLTRLWRKTAASIPAPFPVDASFGVPALKVERDGVTYLVHGVAHGQYGPPRRSAVLSMIRRAAASGHAIYSEQNLPAYYGYKAGLETLDHASADGDPAEVVAAAPGHTPASLLVKRALDWAIAPGSALAALAWGLASPASVLAWVLLPFLGALAWLVLTGGLPLMRWRRRRRAAGARADGLEDIAEQYADEAANFFVAKPDLEALRGLELPQPLGATADPYSARSRAIADAVASAASSRAAGTVHVVVGHLHAHEVAWRLAEGPRNRAPESQMS